MTRRPLAWSGRKRQAKLLLGDLAFLPHLRYEDFNSGIDRVAEYGLAALVGGIALKKLGLLALAGVFLLKIWKVGMLLVLGAGAAIRRWLAPRKRD